MTISISELVTIGMFLITCGTLIWRMALLSAAVKQNKESIKIAHTRIDKYAKEHRDEMCELREEISNLGKTQARIEERLSTIIEMLKNK